MERLQFFGWANALRYCAPLIVVPAIAATAIHDWRTPTTILFGVVWGVGAWLAQDSLTTTATAVVLLLALLWLTQTISLARAVRILRDLVIGFAGVVCAVLLYYTLHGAAGALLDVYFLFPRAITVGLGNTWWPVQESGRPDRISYYLTLPFLIACVICTLCHLPTLRLVTPLDHHRTRFLAFLCVQLVCYQSVLVSSDSSHLMSTMIALPFVLVLGFLYLPQWLAAGTWGRCLVRAGFVVIAVLVYPTLIQATDLSGLARPARRFQAVRWLPQTIGSGQDASDSDRTRPLLPNEPLFLGGDPVSTGEFRDFAGQLRAIVGARKTYCVRVGWIAGGLIAFLADLTPAPHPPAGDLLTINDSVRRLVADHIRAHPQEYEAFIGPSLKTPEAEAFLESHRGAVTIERRLGHSTVYILLSQL
jgi:hypothetical protein